MFFSNKGNSEILEALDNIDLFINNQINSIPNITSECTGFNKEIKNKIEKIINSLKEKNDDELKVYGEIMLISEKLADGNINDKIHHTETSNEKLNYISKTYNILIDNLKKIVDTILETLKEFSNQNYTNRVDMPELQGELKMLVTGVNSLRETITSILTENKANGLALDSNTSILLENIKKLSKGSNEAAASLEESAAALEEITSNIKNNTNKIEEMSNFSKELTALTKNGELLANETTKAMDDINNEIKSINDAITIIDQIAFQTNILSLNAAVEAATAGEAGKGFAVVAQEVRNLASRSAEAAKEIKLLVGSATQEANNGKTASTEMIKEYDLLNENIQKTKEIIENISSSLKDQEKGIEQVNIAISDLDRATQQNALKAQETKEIASHNDQMATTMVVETNKTNFFGRDDFNRNNK